MIYTADYRRAAATSALMREKIKEANQPPLHATIGTAEVVPFPASRQLGVVRNELNVIAEHSDVVACKQLHDVVRRHCLKLKKLGVASEKIEIDAAALREAFGI